MEEQVNNLVEQSTEEVEEQKPEFSLQDYMEVLNNILLELYHDRESKLIEIRTEKKNDNIHFKKSSLDSLIEFKLWNYDFETSDLDKLILEMEKVLSKQSTLSFNVRNYLIELHNYTIQKLYSK